MHRIGIDCRHLLHPGFGESAGIGHYTYYLVRELLCIDRTNEYVLFFDSLERGKAQEIVGNHPRATVRYLPFHAQRKFLPVFYSQILVRASFLNSRLDLLHIPGGTAPLSYPLPFVVTVHDLAIYRHPEWFPGGQWSSVHLTYPATVKGARRIITPSRSTKEDTMRFFNVSADRIDVVPHGVDSNVHVEDASVDLGDLRKKYGIPSRYILYLGTIEPRKNVAGLVRAYRRMITDHPDLRSVGLVIAGRTGWKADSALQEIALAVRDGFRVQRLGYVPHEDKFWLLTHAACFAFPSFFEGFGLPVLEAMSRGVPVVSSNVSSIPEITRDAALLGNPKFEFTFAPLLARVLTDAELARTLQKKGQSRAREFTWEKTARETLAVYKRAISASPKAPLPRE